MKTHFANTMSGVFLVFYLFGVSFVVAVMGYYLMWHLMPGHYVFGALFRMVTYHQLYPEKYIFICCAVFSLTGSVFMDWFGAAKGAERFLVCVVVVCLTVLISAPLGGMLWHWHDMMAGYWPAGYWSTKLFVRGPLEGLKYAVPILVLSLPYVLCGCIAMYFILLSGSKLLAAWQAHDQPPEPEQVKL